MKSKNSIDELLSGYIDDALTPREKTQVRRLLTNDPSIARRLEQLQRIRGLYRALPVAQAPADITGRVTSLLERRTLLEQNSVVSAVEQRRGAVSLFFRKFVAAAAMFALVALLGAVIYSIIAPQPQEGSSVAGDPATMVTPDEGRPVESAPRVVAMGFTGRLELKTADLIAIDGLVNKAVAADTLIESEIERLATTSRYSLKCNPRSLDRLLAGLVEAWPKVQSARLVIETGTADNTVVIESVTPIQVSQIASQDNPDKTIQVARNFATANRMTDDTGVGLVSPPLDNMPIPRPRLTSRQDADLDSGKVDLVILIESVN
ncbi:MAG TPA: hypothetical protein ENN81_11460 [Phycisphaerales bacterium]|nr:hypothetical protein [Phycisphaerales bacterium]